MQRYGFFLIYPNFFKEKRCNVVFFHHLEHSSSPKRQMKIRKRHVEKLTDFGENQILHLILFAYVHKKQYFCSRFA